MKISNRKFIGILLALGTVLTFQFSLSLGDSIFGQDYMTEWSDEDGDVVILMMLLSLYYFCVGLLGCIGIFSFWLKGKIWKGITKIIAVNICITILLMTFMFFFMNVLFGAIGAGILVLYIWGLHKLWKMCKNV